MGQKVLFIELIKEEGAIYVYRDFIKIVLTKQFLTHPHEYIPLLLSPSPNSLKIENLWCFLYTSSF